MPAPVFSSVFRLGLARGVSLCMLIVATPALAEPIALPDINVSADRPSSDSRGAPASQGSAVASQATPVAAQGQNDYLIDQGKAGAKFDIPNKEVPQSIVEIPQKLLVEQNDIYLNDALRNVASVQPTYSDVSGAPIFRIRGFVARNIYRDGLRDETFDRSAWLGDIDRIEVLKGPASVLYGDGSLGGSINYVTKKALGPDSIKAFGWYGNFDTAGGGFDVTRRVTDSTVARVIVDKTYSDTYVQNNPVRQSHAALLTQTQVSDAATLSTRFEDRERNSGVDTGLPVYGTLLGTKLSLPIWANYNTNWSRRTDIGRSGAVDLDYRINNDWTFHSGAAVNYYWFNQGLSVISGYTANNTKLTRTFQIASSETWQGTQDSYLQNKGTLFGLPNLFLVGTELSYSHVTRPQSTSGSFSFPVRLYGDTTAGPGYNASSNLTFKQYREGHYVQDQIELLPGLKAIGGVRYDLVSRDSADTVTAVYQSQRNDALSERAGLTYEFIPGYVAYGGYSHSFAPPGSTVSLGAVKGQLLPPEIGDNVEAGVKADLNNWLTATAAVFRLDRRNVVSADPVSGYATTTGEQLSQGFELDASVKLAPGWNLSLSYAYDDARVKKDTTYRVGAPVDNAPKNAAHLWSSYEFQSGDFKGLSFGGGVTYVGDRAGVLVKAATPNVNYVLPEYATFDLMAAYKYENLKFSINATNVFDKRYYLASASSTAITTVYMGQPATVLARVDVEY
ncbi:hypothetical protein CCR94_21650 [Rhodoblastus sphagnicola]|uniref:TonB-dependent siderophore receptor n=1 Tax=Rhodoblastus sphagnicola TaxID=333368 RepID=A0A2S6MWI1_9HYPH|nr:TonB-dependent receptor [Rhodoblastus sphagnicola]MBB4200004.1 iron complex outermembrane receptor protein [Rhodoblastus sphagnicola]PPQ26719.1 hypothetical protein CCR94_21650 [Rhodoblastus sphagnicola]